jgi:hypothetical protein
LKAVSRQRRETIFGIAVLGAGFSIANLCLTPMFFINCVPQSVFPTLHQETFFFDMFGFAAGCWLLSWVSAVNEWKGMARLGQWLGIILLSIDQTIMIGVWRDIMIANPIALPGLLIAPTFVQIYLLGLFFGFFTLPALTQSGNRTLTGLGTLVLILPWLLARTQIVTGVQFLHGMFFKS